MKEVLIFLFVTIVTKFGSCFKIDVNTQNIHNTHNNDTYKDNYYLIIHNDIKSFNNMISFNKISTYNNSRRLVTNNTNLCSDSNCAFCSENNKNFCYQCKDINLFVNNGTCTSMMTDLNCLSYEYKNNGTLENLMKCTRCVQGYTLESSLKTCT